MKPQTIADGAEGERVYRAANQIAIRRFGCSIDSLRDRIVVREVLEEARERRRWWQQRRFTCTPAVRI